MFGCTVHHKVYSSVPVVTLIRNPYRNSLCYNHVMCINSYTLLISYGLDFIRFNPEHGLQMWSFYPSSFQYCPWIVIVLSYIPIFLPERLSSISTKIKVLNYYRRINDFSYLDNFFTFSLKLHIFIFYLTMTYNVWQFQHIPFWNAPMFTCNFSICEGCIRSYKVEVIYECKIYKAMIKVMSESSMFS